jgi:hypothetical protein
VLKNIAAGTAVAGAMALAGKWSKPVVNTIILPAHAQATNPAPPPPTTPAPTTTSGECITMLVGVCYQLTRDPQTEFITTVTVSGSVQPVQGSVLVTVQINASLDGGGQRTDTFPMYTRPDGSFSGTHVYGSGTHATGIDSVSAEGPCNSVDVPPCMMNA